jgi:hypothetical protein
MARFVYKHEIIVDSEIVESYECAFSCETEQEACNMADMIYLAKVAEGKDPYNPRVLKRVSWNVPKKS